MAFGRVPKNPYRVNLTSGEVSQTFKTPDESRRWIAQVKQAGSDPGLVDRYFVEFWDPVAGWSPLESKKARRITSPKARSHAQLDREIAEALGHVTAETITNAQIRDVRKVVTSDREREYCRHALVCAKDDPYCRVARARCAEIFNAQLRVAVDR